MCLRLGKSKLVRSLPSAMSYNGTQKLAHTISRGTRDDDVTGDGHSGGPFIETRSKSEATDVA